MTRKLRKSAVAARYGDVDTRTIDRWLIDPELDFPKPIYIKTQPLWDEAELEQWERTRASRRRASRTSETAA